MHDIVLIRPKYNSHIITPPLGLGYLSSYIQKYGKKALIIDGLRDNLSNQEILERVKNTETKYVGITCLTAFYEETVELSKMLKEEGYTVLIGGVHPTFMPKDTLKDTLADFVIVGEGEIALNEFLDGEREREREIQGIYSLKDFENGKEILKAEKIENLDDLPFPDWEQINPNLYPRAPHGAIVKGYPIGIIMSSRGCPYRCKFCASPKFYDRSIRFRSPENVVEEIKYLIKNFKVKEIQFEDDNLTLKREHIEKICNLMIKNKIKIHWSCPNGIRADKVDEQIIRLMKKAGCYNFAYGIESANPQILKNINKDEDINLIKKSIEIANKCRISCQGFFIFGLPGETKETIRETIDFAVKSKLTRAQFLILDVLPGCQLWTDLDKKFVPKFNKNSYKEPEWLPENLTAEDLLEAQSLAFKKFYFRPRIMFKMLQDVSFSQIKYLLIRLLEYGILRKR